MRLRALDRFALPWAYILQEVARATLTNLAAVHSGGSDGHTGSPHLLPLLVLLSEALKLIFAAAVVWRRGIAVGWKAQDLPLAIPALLQFTTHVLYRCAWDMTTAPTVQMLVLMRLPLLALMHHLVVQRQKDSNTWLALAVMCSGTLLTQLHTNAKLIFTPAAILVCAAISANWAVSFLFLERALKDTEHDIWRQQLYIYLFGTAFAALSVASNAYDGSRGPAWDDKRLLLFLVAAALASACSGLVLAQLLKRYSALAQLCGTAVAAVFIAGVGAIVLPVPAALSPLFVVGATMVLVSGWQYLYYFAGSGPLPPALPPADTATGADPEAAAEIAAEGEQGGQRGQKKGWAALQLSVRLSLCTLAAAVVVALLFHRQLPGRPAKAGSNLRTDWSNVQEGRLVAGGNMSGWRPLPAECYVADAQPQLGYRNDCVVEEAAKRKIDISCNFDELEAFSEWSATSACPRSPTGKGMLYHTYWAGPLVPNQLRLLDSFLVTQTLTPCTKFILWLGEESTLQDPQIAAYRPEYARYFEFRYFNMTLESQGSCLVHKRAFWDARYREQEGIKVESLSDIIRVLILTKHGGMWVDSDSILLRDLLPVAQLYGPFAPYAPWDVYNNNVLYLGAQPSSPIAERLLSGICYELPYDHSLWQQTWDFREPPFWVWNAGMLRLCEASGCGLTRLPLAWVDPDWACGLMNRACHDIGQSLDHPASFLKGAFVWHARWLRHELCQATNDSASMTLMWPVWKLLDQHFQQPLKLHGQDLFPKGQQFTGKMDIKFISFLHEFKSRFSSSSPKATNE